MPVTAEPSGQQAGLDRHRDGGDGEDHRHQQEVVEEPSSSPGQTALIEGAVSEEERFQDDGAESRQQHLELQG